MFICIAVIGFAIGCEPAQEEPVVEEPEEEVEEPEEPEEAVEEPEEEELDFPTGTVTILIGLSVGGSTDMAVRAVQPYLQNVVGVPVVIENHPAAGARIAGQELLNRPADGHTLFATVYPAYLGSEIYEDGTINFTELKHVFNITGYDGNSIIVRADSEIRDFDHLLELAEERDITFASTAGISNSSLSYALMAGYTGVEFRQIIYDTGSEAIMAAIGGHVDMAVASNIAARPLVEDGEARVIISTVESTPEGLGDPPVLADYADGVFKHANIGFAAHPDTPDELVETWANFFEQVVSDQSFIDETGDRIVLEPLGPAEFEERVDFYVNMLWEMEDIIRTELLGE